MAWAPSFGQALYGWRETRKTPRALSMVGSPGKYTRPPAFESQAAQASLKSVRTPYSRPLLYQRLFRKDGCPNFCLLGQAPQAYFTVAAGKKEGPRLA